MWEVFYWRTGYVIKRFATEDECLDFINSLPTISGQMDYDNALVPMHNV